MPLLVGLGNPGPKYEDTRHNIGFSLVDAFASAAGLSKDWKIWNKSLLLKTTLAGHPFWIAKPQTFMNLSGEAVQALLGFYKIPVREMAVVADDVTLNAGSLRLRSQGGHGGHNGLRDIIDRVGEGFPRIRVGVGPCPAGWDLADFVLGKINPAEREALQPAFADFSKLVETGFTKGWDLAGSHFNRRLDLPPR